MINFADFWQRNSIASWDVTGGLVTNPYYEGTSATWAMDLRSGLRPFNPTTQPRKHIAKCTHCGVPSMIPEGTDKIMPLICPQCGSPLDA